MVLNTPPSCLESSLILSVLYAVVIYTVMLYAAQLLLTNKAVSNALTPHSGRYGSLDGLRGVLGTGVMIHHSIAAYGYFTMGEWKWGTSPVLNQLGQSTVALFFMITGFLFTLKVKQLKVAWLAFYMSRVARLLPLYFITVFLVFVIVLSVMSKGVLYESYPRLVFEFVMWISFVILGRPEINGVLGSWTVMAGVNWSLKYEALFYLIAVPCLHISYRVFRFNASKLLTVSLVLLGMLFFIRGNGGVGGWTLYIAHFLGGVIIAFVFQIEVLKNMIRTKMFKCFGVTALCLLFSMTYSTTNVAVICTMLTFATVVGGASCFGLLNTRAAIWLGDISYGIYLLHGMVLWLTLKALSHSNILLTIGLGGYLVVVLIIGVTVTLLASCSYVLLERPIMLRVGARYSRKV